MTGDNKNKDHLNGITIEVNGSVIGKVKEFNVASKPTEYVEKMYTIKPPAETTISLSRDKAHRWAVELFGPEVSSGKSIVGVTALQKLLEPGHLYVKAQLEMWGVESTGQVCWDCLGEIITTLEYMGYRVWFSESPTIDDDWAETSGVSIFDCALRYGPWRQKPRMI